ncbi:MAG: hypothetical protein M1836_008114 [Candelina mexicana]|nr:MAG: hypothetical protein M1836_008114 [Candelina mexicana]
MTETHNVLSHPAGAELSVGEGIYILRDELHLATPPPHPSEAPLSVQPNNNPLATSPVVPTAGTRLSVTVLNQRSPALIYKINTATSARSGAAQTFHSIKESSEVRSSVDASSSDTNASPSTNDFGYAQNTVPAFGEGNASLLPGTFGKDSLKRRKPKNNILKSNSSFISRVIQHEALSKWLQERNPDGLLAFANINRAFEWLDLSSSTHKADYLTKILFTKAHALCADVNAITKGLNHLDVIIGFSSGDVLWYEPFSAKYGRINKNGVINASPVAEIRWIPGSENLFFAAHADGTLICYDKEKEDATFVAEENGITTNGPAGTTLNIQKSVNSTNQKLNPVSSWKLSNQKINGFAISSDGQHLAVVSEDGTLRIIDYLNERYISYHSTERFG